MADGITVKVEGLEALKRRFTAIGANVNRSLARGLNDTATHARSVAVRGITQEWNIKAKDVRSSFSLRRASQSSLVATLSSSGKPIPLLYFAAKQGPKGVRYKIKKRGKRDLLVSGWINLLRKGRAVGIRRALSRLPITAPGVPGVHNAWRQQLPDQLPQISAFLQRRMAQLLALEIERRG